MYSAIFFVQNWNAMIRPVLFILLLISTAKSVVAQTNLSFEFDPSIPVWIGSDSLEHPWAGGLNFVQFSDIDVDYDGDMDLFVFDRSGDEISLFITEEVNGEPVYRYQHGGHALFPADVRYRAAMVDYNGDGKNDLFTYGIGGLKVYKNVGNAGAGVQWQLAKNLVMSEYPGNDYTNLYVSSSDIPALVDVEGDGDIDVLTFNIAGERLEYHQNQSMELYGIPDSLIYVVKNECWGQFREDVNNNGVVLNDTQSPCGSGSNVPDPQRAEAPEHIRETEEENGFEPTRHAGSTVLALDMDDNGVYDLVLGDVSYPNLTMLINGGTEPNTNSAMISMETNFPSNTTPASMQLFPAAFYVDVNHDNVKDLIVGASARTVSQNQKSVTYYENLGTNSLPDFLYRSKSFLQGDMIDHGLGSIPMVFDQNGDGKRDLLVAHFFRYKETLNKECAFLVYRNTGTATEPEMTYYDSDFFGLTSLGLGLRSIPSFGDLDDDGDVDMVIGLENGTLNRYTNSAGAGNPVNFIAQAQLTDNNGTAINVISYAAPQLFDLNDDGLLDLIVGKKTGELAYYENTGTAAAPIFTLKNDTLGGIDVGVNDPNGYAVPHFFRVNDTTHLFLGAYDGKLHYYNGIDGHLHEDSTFHTVSHNFLGLDVGLYSSFWVEDIDNDGQLNLFVGQDLGGLHLLEVNPDSNLGLDELEEQHNWILYPNPANEIVTLAALTIQEEAEVAVYNMLGEKVASTSIFGKGELDISNYRKGVYLVVITSGDNKEVLRLVKN